MTGSKTLAAAALAGVLTAAGAAPAAAQFRYDTEYPQLGYTQTPQDNPVSQLVADMQSGAVELEYREERGYLDSMLETLGIDPSSQVLVYSGTSLQYPLIGAETPRAVYFNDTVYIGYVQNSHILEIAAMDAKLGPVFYTFDNRPEQQLWLRETGRCLNCHDTQGMMGGGVPVLPVRSILVDRSGAPLTYEAAPMTDDATPLAERWGGWYVTGQHGGQGHLGNILLDSAADLTDLEAQRLGNLETLEGLVDTDPYLAPTSDIVALMVLEHQVAVQNQITYVGYKAPAILERMGWPGALDAESWDDLPEQARSLLPRMLDKLVDTMLFAGAVELTDEIKGNSGFAEWFEAQGVRDGVGRSLRDLDLQTRLFEYPVSYEIHSEAFDNLPAYAKDYFYQAVADVIEGRDESGKYAQIDASDREAIKAIIADTKPELAAYLAAGEDA